MSNIQKNEKKQIVNDENLKMFCIKVSLFF